MNREDSQSQTLLSLFLVTVKAVVVEIFLLCYISLAFLCSMRLNEVHRHCILQRYLYMYASTSCIFWILLVCICIHHHISLFMVLIIIILNGVAILIMFTCEQKLLLMRTRPLSWILQCQKHIYARGEYIITFLFLCVNLV